MSLCQTPIKDGELLLVARPIYHVYWYVFPYFNLIAFCFPWFFGIDPLEMKLFICLSRIIYLCVLKRYTVICHYLYGYPELMGYFYFFNALKTHIFLNDYKGSLVLSPVLHELAFVGFQLPCKVELIKFSYVILYLKNVIIFCFNLRKTNWIYMHHLSRASGEYHIVLVFLSFFGSSEKILCML